MRLTLARKIGALSFGIATATWIGGLLIASQLVTTHLEKSLRLSIHDQTGFLAGRVRSEVQMLAERARSLGALTRFRSDDDRNAFLQNVVEGDPDLLAISAYERANGADTGEFAFKWKSIASLRPGRSAFHASDLDEIDRLLPADSERLGRGIEDFRIGYRKNGVLATRLAIPLIEPLNATVRTYFVIDIAPGRFSTLLQATHESWIVDRQNQLLGRQINVFSPAKDLDLGEASAGELEFKDAAGSRQIAAFERVGVADLIVLTQAPTTMAYAVRGSLIWWVTVFSLFVTAAATAAALALSSSIRRSVQSVIDAAARVARGDFTVRAAHDQRAQTRMERMERLAAFIGFRAKGEPDELHELISTFNRMVVGLSEKNPLQATFEKFHTKEIADKLVAGEVKLAGERLEATVFFSSVRSFAAMNGQMEPEVFVDLLNDYMTRMVAIIRAHGGFVDKFMGDEIVALWGVPIAHHRDKHNAVQACLAMRAELLNINDLRQFRGLAPIRIGMGLASGTVLAGNMGSEDRREYTVIGDPVTEATRLEDRSELVGTDLLVASSVAHDVRQDFEFLEKGDAFTVKGAVVAERVHDDFSGFDVVQPADEAEAATESAASKLVTAAPPAYDFEATATPPVAAADTPPIAASAAVSGTASSDESQFPTHEYPGEPAALTSLVGDSTNAIAPDGGIAARLSEAPSPLSTTVPPPFKIEPAFESDFAGNIEYDREGTAWIEVPANGAPPAPEEPAFAALALASPVVPEPTETVHQTVDETAHETLPEPTETPDVSAAAPAHDQWYVSLAGQVTGPFATERVLDGVRERKLTPKMKVGPTADGPWARIDETAEFAQASAELAPTRRAA